MGSLISSLREYEEQQQDVTGSSNLLTKNEFSALQTSWKIIRLKTADSGMLFFEELFKRHPEYQKLFKPFADIPIENLRQSPKFKAHAVTVMYSLTSLLDNVDNLECLKELINKIVENHSHRGATISHFKDFMEIFMRILQEKWKNEMTQTTLNAWKKVDASIVQYFKDSFEELRT